MTDRTSYWIWLASGVGFASPKPKRILSLYDDIKELYDGGEKELRFCGIFTENEISRLLRTPLDKSLEVINACKSLGYNI